jgi:hypothetical protein
MATKTRSGRSASPGTGKPVPSIRSASQKGVLRKEGEYWTVGYGEQSFRLKDTRGLMYLAHLLGHPAVEFHVLDLFGETASQREEDETSRSGQRLPRGAEQLEKAGMHRARPGDAGEMLDEQAKVAYKRRLSELREELEEAKELGNVERAEQAEVEIDALTKELSRAVGLGGRIGGRRPLRNEPGKASPRRSRRCWKKSRRAMPHWEISCRGASGRETSAPTSLTPIYQ